jgi:hypothetical protein
VCPEHFWDKGAKVCVCVCVCGGGGDTSRMPPGIMNVIYLFSCVLTNLLFVIFLLNHAESSELSPSL